MVGVTKPARGAGKGGTHYGYVRHGKSLFGREKLHPERRIKDLDTKY